MLLPVIKQFKGSESIKSYNRSNHYTYFLNFTKYYNTNSRNNQESHSFTSFKSSIQKVKPTIYSGKIIFYVTFWVKKYTSYDFFMPTRGCTFNKGSLFHVYQYIESLISSRLPFDV